MNSRISDLEFEMQKIGLPLPAIPERAYRRQLVGLLGDHWLRQAPELDTPQMRLRREIESPMLCFKFNELRPEQQEECMESSLWIAEQKYNGVRALAVYVPQHGLRIFSRHHSEQTFLPVEFTDQILVGATSRAFLRNDMTIELMEQFKEPFILDCEITVNKNIEMESGDSTGSKLNAAVALMNMLPEKAHYTQVSQNVRVSLRVFDCLMLGDWLIDKPFLLRKARSVKLIRKLNTVFGNGFWRKAAICSKNKERFLARLWAAGGEGVVLKRIDQPYAAAESRRRDTQVKLKRTMKGEMEQDVDAFIFGSVNGKVGTALEGMVGSVMLAVWLQEGEEEKMHHIATVSGIPMQLRREMTAPDGTLAPQFLNRVVRFDGMAVSARNLRFAHATVDWAAAWRPDKSPHDCVMQMEELRRNII